MDINDDVKKNLLGNALEEIRLTDDIEKEPEVVEQPADVTLVVDSEQKENDLFVLTTLRVTKESYWAELEVEYSWDAAGKLFTCQAKRYRALSNGRHSGNVYLSMSSAGSWGYSELSNDDATQDGQWHTISGGSSVAGNSDYAWINFQYIYDRAGTSDVPMNIGVRVSYTVPAPTFKPIKNVPASPFTMTGGGGIYGAGTVRIRNAYSYETPTAVIQPDGSWSASVKFPAGLVSLDTQAWQQIGSKLSTYTNSPTIYLATLTSPAQGDVLPISEVIFRGTAAPDSTMAVVRADYGDVLAQPVLVPSSMAWQSPMTAQWPSGRLTATASFTYPGFTPGYTLPVTFTVLGNPAISSPAGGLTQERTFSVSGNNRLPGAAVAVLIDMTDTVVGNGAAAQAGTWSANVTLEPGPRRLVARQTHSGKTSGRGVSQLFLIRPPEPTLLSRPKGEGVELYGTGYDGTGVQMHIHQSFTANFYFDAPVNSGNWTKDIPETFVPGSYQFTGKQSVSDGGSGRIYNSSWVDNLSVNVPTPVPTNVTATVNGQRATFAGRGRQWGTYEVKIGIYNNGVALAGVPQATVRTNLIWDTTATADLAPGVYTNLAARQWVNNRWSGDSAKIATMTIPSPPPVFSNPPSNVPSGQRPQISGSAWPGSAIVLKIPGKPDVPLTATGGTFTLNATEEWAPGTYTLTATAAFGGGQPSSPGTRTFTVKSPVPIITTADNAEVDLVPVIEGTGFPGCWVVIYSQATHQPLGSNQVRPDRGWTVTLAEQAPASLTVYAIQQDAQFSENKSDRTAAQTVKVRVPKPGITVPAPNGRPARTSTFTGTTTASQGTVELSIKGESQPFIKDIPLKPDGSWEETLTLSVGPKTVEARLRQKTYLSEPFERVVTVVPAVPVIDTPRNGEALGRLLRISGFGYPGDTVHVQRTGSAHNFAPVTVKEDGTWSASFEHNMIATNGIKAFARAGAGLDSLASSTSTFLLLGPAPQITEPLTGDWAGVRPLYSGLATPGASITVASWFNAEDVLAPATEADAYGRWAVVGNKDLPVGAARVIVRQTVDGKASEWAESGRFMVERKTAQFEAPTVQFPLVEQEVGRRPMFSGGGEPGAEIFICKVNDMNTVLATTRVDRNGKWAVRSQIELPVAESVYTYSVRQSRDGVVSKWLLPNRNVKVIQMPVERVIVDQPVNDAAQELERRPVFAGRGIAGAEVQVIEDQTETVYATTTVNAQGYWSVRCEVELTVQETAHQINVRQSMDGQDSPWLSTAIGFKVADEIDHPEIASPVADAQISPHEVIRGTAMPGVEVRLYRSGNGNVIWGKGVADALGQWVIVTGGLPLGGFRMGGKGYKDTLQSPWMLERDFTVIDAG
ncbi:hypothetical protein [Pseudomonas sp. EL_65y_Pfl2_R96]|uniref:hypothetical protein n=1 Tax=Pseudomonas sp. EL_65y_Pfl2_R96 TaxID=3088699 RepID=UPI0030D986CE